MDEGPFRVSRPADRRVVNRSEPTYRQPEEPQPVKAEPTPVERPTATHRNTKAPQPSRRFKFPLLLIIGLLILALAAWFAISNMNKGGDSAIDTKKYQAVFFTNGQVYFGKLSTLNDENLKLTDIFYLQTKSTDATDTNPQQTSSDQSDVQLIKLGSEIHGPEDAMVISKDQVLFYENLKTDGKVANSISEYKKAH
ncbi:MAG: hypothetical protein JWO54_241 [Candidatus Saccharibacteria bacterium]|nr:hypothetical protein [Candidatus Saccharibacteria bacterium]MDB5180483.1 hypothetical protein [Candidatus Saccharibacteria bacterium]